MPTAQELSELVQQHRSEFDGDVDQALVNDSTIANLRNAWLGRKGGKIAALMGQVPSLAPDQRRAFGAQVNELKRAVEARLATLEESLAAKRRPQGAVDITLPGRAPILGSRHPLSLVRERVQEIFTRLGYQVLEGPEIEDDYHNFEALNMPADHPARDMQDTLYLASPLASPESDLPTRGKHPRTPQPLTLLRTHTSAMQIRHMERHDPPVRLVAIGPVYRRDDLDLTHTPMFHQVEGLVVGKGVTLADLKGTLTAMAQQFFGADTPVRMRPSFFPYTEPSAELDIGCFRCKGSGCSMCKQTGWIEILGSGMVHPVVFEYVGYDPNEVTGFAFGMGIERVALLMWGVEDIRLFYENDVRFLEQFGL